jgi:pilus assembly protein TadC
MSIVTWVLGAIWGICLALPFAAWGRRAAVRERLRHAGASDVGASESRPNVLPPIAAAFARRLSAGPVGRVARDMRRRRIERACDARVAREMPVALDLLGVAVDAGCTPFLAVETAAQWSPPELAVAFARVRRSCSLGVPFARALDDAVSVTPRLRPVADALLVSDRLGAPVAPVLARLATEERTALRRCAEAHARRVPVRLLFPLVFLVLPAFVLLTVVPGLASGLAQL